ncbi:hypothetical protein GGR52DRAFT_578846 [Hypoxylon sp. FL1284]|nr:hypothetical protein GGR52DRAFT_578846 [Hypoxylon sp. FL1284]
MQQKTKDAAANVPTHPIPAMQPAFVESLIEVTKNPVVPKPKVRFADAKGRRQYLLDGAKGSKLHYDLWRYRPGQRYHELWKLMAQISFGVYLMLNGIANSNEQVVSILQGHIDEVDEYLETTLEDIDLATQDLKERVDFLKLPMENIATFEQMLEDRNFRLQIVNGNEKIEHILSRTTAALEAAVEDLSEGLKATGEFARYLETEEDRPWRQQRPEVGEVFDAMRGNAQGWNKAFIDLQGTTSALRALIVKLERMVAEMDYRAGEVSRRTRGSVAPFSNPADRYNLPKNNSPHSSTRSSDRRPPRLVLSKNTSQKSAAGSTGTRETMLVQYAFPVEPMEPVELEADSVPKTIVVARNDSGSEPESDSATEEADPRVDEGLYILQPRTYTPLPPAPIPSPRVQDEPKPSPAPVSTPRQEEQPKRTSLRERLSLKGSNLPEAIQVPPRNMTEAQKPKCPIAQQQSPRYNPSRIYQGPDSAYGSDNEARPPVRSIAESSDMAELPPPNFPTTVPSPRSDQQHYFPVRASPHSPLQQRPWTAGTHAYGNHVRNQPSSMGMSMLSNVTTLNPEHKKLKKKRSAFGWFKKAFSLDEEERAEFEARRAQQAPVSYNHGRSPRFLDGKRLPDPNRRYR